MCKCVCTWCLIQGEYSCLTPTATLTQIKITLRMKTCFEHSGKVPKIAHKLNDAGIQERSHIHTPPKSQCNPRLYRGKKKVVPCLRHVVALYKMRSKVYIVCLMRFFFHMRAAELHSGIVPCFIVYFCFLFFLRTLWGINWAKVIQLALLLFLFVEELFVYLYRFIKNHCILRNTWKCTNEVNANIAI